MVRCVAPRDRETRRGGTQGCWYKRKHLAWEDGYEILLCVEASLWDVQACDAGVQKILDRCRRAVLAERYL